MTGRPGNAPDVACGSLRARELIYVPEPELDDPLDLYHQASKFTPATMRRVTVGAERILAMPSLLKSTSRASKHHPHLPAIPLPQPRLIRQPLDVALGRRTSERRFSGKAVDLGVLATLLHAGGGIRESEFPARRLAPSAGALYPLDLYVFPLLIEGLTKGLYHFEPSKRILEQLEPQIEAESVEAALPSSINVPGGHLAGCAVVLALVANLWRSRIKYGPRAYRFALLETGHIAQNILLAAAAFGLAAYPFGGFYDDRMNALLGVNGVDEMTLYLLLVGHREELP